jgi:hypothetical protein
LCATIGHAEDVVLKTGPQNIHRKKNQRFSDWQSLLKGKFTSVSGGRLQIGFKPVGLELVGGGQMLLGLFIDGGKKPIRSIRRRDIPSKANFGAYSYDPSPKLHSAWNVVLTDIAAGEHTVELKWVVFDGDGKTNGAELRLNEQISVLAFKLMQEEMKNIKKERAAILQAIDAELAKAIAEKLKADQFKQDVADIIMKKSAQTNESSPK